MPGIYFHISRFHDAMSYSIIVISKAAKLQNGFAVSFQKKPQTLILFETVAIMFFNSCSVFWVSMSLEFVIGSEHSLFKEQNSPSV